MYTIKQAALRSGVNVPLLRAWERRYGVVAPARTDSGYRLYDDDAIDRLRAMRSLVDAGWSARQAAVQVAGATSEELAGLTPDAPSVQDLPDDAVSAFVDGAARVDSAAVERALDDMFAGGSFERVVEDRLLPALHALGNGWAAGTVDIAGEHAASGAVARRLSMAFEAAGSASGTGRPVLVGLPSGARHELAALAFATAARRAGLPVVYLGQEVPAPSWIAAVERTGARAIVVGAVIDGDVPAADEVVKAVRAAHPDVVVATGGRRSSVVGEGSGALRLPDRLTDAVAALRRALDGGT